MKKLIITAMCITLLVLTSCNTPPEEPVETTEATTTEVPQVEPVETTEDSLVAENEKLIADIEKAREMAIAAGAEQFFSDELMVVDVAATEAQSVYVAGGDEKAFNESANDILYQYKALEQAALAAKADARIAQMGFASYNEDKYAEANLASQTAFDLFNSGADGKSIYDEVKKASDAYMQVLNTAFSSLANEEREKFLGVKEQADEIKAGVADKSNYNNAVVFFTQGDADLLSEKPENAYNNFSVATESMTVVFETVAEKRRVAQEAMDRAKRRLEDADEVASTADTIVPLSDVESLTPIAEESTQGGE